jgi:hypothetical protein
VTARKGFPCPVNSKMRAFTLTRHPSFSI